MGSKRTLTQVRHVPRLRKNLISLGALEALGCKFIGFDRFCKVSKEALVIMKGQRQDNIYKLIGNTSVGGGVATVADSTSARMWHARLGHMKVLFE